MLPIDVDVGFYLGIGVVGITYHFLEVVPHGSEAWSSVSFFVIEGGTTIDKTNLCGRSVL